MKPGRVWPQRLGLAAVGLALLGALAFVALRTGPLAPTRVTVVQAAQGTFQPQLFGIGTVEARRSVLVGPTLAGRVRMVAVDVGASAVPSDPFGPFVPFSVAGTGSMGRAACSA